MRTCSIQRTALVTFGGNNWSAMSAIRHFRAALVGLVLAEPVLKRASDCLSTRILPAVYLLASPFFAVIESGRKKALQALIASISVCIPRIAIARFMLYASTCKLISARTRGSVLVRKCGDPIQALSVPNTCSTV